MNKKQINQRVTIRHQEELTLLQEHRQMISAVKQLPSCLFIARTYDQKIWLKDRQNFWVWMGLRLNYLQLEQLGFQPVDPIDNPDLDSRQREYLNLFSSHLFQMLQIIIKGFSFIKNTAIHEKRDFYFDNARELFIEICRDWAKSGLEDAFSEGIDRGSKLNQVRTTWTTMSKFYRGRLSKDYTGKSVCKNELNEEQILSDLKNSDWFGFWQFAIFEHRFKELQKPWKEFLKTHKSLCKFIHKTKPQEGTTLKMLKWNSGYAVHSDTNSPAKFNHSLHFLTPE